MLSSLIVCQSSSVTDVEVGWKLQALVGPASSPFIAFSLKVDANWLDVKGQIYNSM